MNSKCILLFLSMILCLACKPEKESTDSLKHAVADEFLMGVALNVRQSSGMMHVQPLL